MKCWRLRFVVAVLVCVPAGAAFASAQRKAIVGSAWYKALSQAYAYDHAGRRDAAWQAYGRAVDSATNAKEFNQACMGVVYDAPLQRRRLPHPWYLTFYADPMWMQRNYASENSSQQNFSDGFLQSRLRFGRHFDEIPGASVYGYFTYTTDSASRVGRLPEIYNDNYAGLGLGIDYRPAADLRLYAEVGPDYDLLDRGHTRWHTDLTLGVEYYGAWGAGNRCSYALDDRLRPFADLYAAAARYGRYDNNVIGQVTARIGLRMFNYRFSSLSAYLLINTTADSKDLYYNNVFEIGPGVSWRPYIVWPLSLRLEYRIGRYWRNLSQIKSTHYQTLLLQAIIYFEQ